MGCICSSYDDLNDQYHENMNNYFRLIYDLSPKDYERTEIYNQSRYYCQMSIDCLVLMDRKKPMEDSTLIRKIEAINYEFIKYQRLIIFPFIPFDYVDTFR
jgi:hypothetical protein